MTAAGWLALTAVLLVFEAGPVGAGQLGALSAAGRLATRVAHGPTGRFGALPWPHLGLIAGAAAATAAYLAGGLLLAVPVAALALLAARLAADIRSRRQVAARHRDLLTAVRVLVGELEAGSAPGSALAAAAGAGARVAAEFGAAATACERAGDPGAELIGSADVEIRVIGIAWQLGDATGAALAGVLGRVVADLSAADDQRRVVATALAGPRSSAGLLAGLPVLGLGLGTAMGARPVAFLTTAPAGRALCCAGILLDVLGILWMRRILRRAERP